MPHDPFARFEQSRLGLLIPMLLFVAGAIVTLIAITLLVNVADREQELALEHERQIEQRIEQEVDSAALLEADKPDESAVTDPAVAGGSTSDDVQ